MNMKIFKGAILGILACMLLTAVNAQAKWWIFGTSEEPVSINYLYINNMSYDEMAPKVTLFRETLPEGQIEIKGKATVKKGTIGSVRVSTDGKATWQEAQLAEGGAFQYRFRPEVGKTYVVYVEIMDTRGVTNEIEATRKEIALSDRNVLASVKEVLDAMVDAYRNRNATKFMAYVSDDFRGDASNLDRAVRKDFSYFDNIDLKFTVSNIVTDAKGLVYVALNFSRFLSSTKTGRSVSDRGLTEFVFKQANGGPRVYSMKNPLLFGMTDAGNVATGTTKQLSAEPIIIVDDRGNVARVPGSLYDKLAGSDSLKITANLDGTTTITTDDATVKVNQQGTVVSACGGRAESGNRELVVPGHPPRGFQFATGEVVNYDGGDFMATGGTTGKVYVFLASGVTYRDLGNVALASVSEAPATGYTAPGASFYLFEGKTYAFRLANGKYGLMEIKNVIAVGPYVTVLFDYKYQPDGSRCF